MTSEWKLYEGTLFQYENYMGDIIITVNSAPLGK